MKQRPLFGFMVLLVALIVAGGTGLWAQWLQTMTLRTELDVARAEVGELARLRAENMRLRAHQLSPAQLEALRADHAALPRLRAELEALNKAAAP